jgi:phytoene dehydrogenase-like protein
VTGRLDAIIVGGGHNGLTAAAYLARAGKSVLVLERRAILGGASATEEFAPGFRNSTCAFVAGYLRPELIEDLQLARRGLSITPLRSDFFPMHDGRSLLLVGQEEHDRRELGAFSSRDYDGLQAMQAALDPLGAFFGRLMLLPPPSLSARPANLLRWLRILREFMRLSLADRQRLIRILSQSADDFLARYLESDAAKLGHAFAAISGNMSDLRAPTTAFKLVHGKLCQVNGEQGVWGLPRGGMGAISEALADAAREYGAQIRVSSPVRRVLVERGRATGVELEDGEVLHAGCVLSNADPRRTFLGLVDQAALPAEFRRDMEGYRCESGTFRMNFALDALPDFTCRPGDGQHLRGTTYVIPSLAYVQEAYECARRGDWSAHPILEVVIPSLHDDSLAPPGKHVMSISARYFPRHLSGNRSWDDCREAAADTIVDTLTRFAPNFRASIIARQSLSPLDLEREYGLTGGDVLHGQYELHQLFSMRPHPDAAQYRTPVPGLYLCGAGAHPGGGVSGLPGRNAARAVLRDL